MADLFPTAQISRGPGNSAPFAKGHHRLDELPVTDPYTGALTSVGAILRLTDTDAWLVVHDGAVVDEQYFGTMTEATPHLLMSVSKSLVGSVAAALVDAGTLHTDRPVTGYVPLLHGTGYEGATVRHLLDMRTGIDFSEAYLDPAAGVRVLEQAIGWATRTDPLTPTSMYGYLRTLRAATPHGGPFHYKSCDTDTLGWVCEAASCAWMPQLMSDSLWSRLGCEHDANIGIDRTGTGMFDGGISATVRDLARFGQMLLSRGTSMTGATVLSAEWVDDTFAGAQDSRSAFAHSPDDNRMPGGMYRNQFWFPYPDRAVLLALGIHGQLLYVNRTTQVVAVKFSSWPAPQDAAKLFGTLAAIDRVSLYLGS